MFNYYDVISIKVESPKVNTKIERRVDLCHRNFFLTGYQAQKVCLCSEDRQIQPHLNSQLERILINAHSNGLRARTARYIETLVRNCLSNLHLAFVSDGSKVSEYKHAKN